MRFFGLHIVKVIGRSMEPALAPDSFAVFWGARALQKGDIILADHPRFGWIIKKVNAIDNGELSLTGVCAESTSTARLGLISKDRALGRLILKIKEPERNLYG